MTDLTINANKKLTSELRPSPKLLLPALIFLAFILIYVSHFLPQESSRLHVRFFALLVYAFAGAILALDHWRPQVGRWFTIVALVVIISLGFSWLGLSESLLFIVIPIIWAAILLHLSAATITATGQTILLVVLFRYGVVAADSTTIILAVVAVWLTLGTMVAVYLPMYQIMDWLWKYFQRAQQELEEARNRKVELEQTLPDLALANREMALLSEKLAAMRRRAEEAHEAKAAFVAKISHEFRTPLSMITGFIDTLTEAPEIYEQEIPPLLKKDLEIVYRNCTPLANMINDVLDLSQTETGRLTIHREEADLAADIKSAVAGVQPLVERKKLSLQTIIPENLPKVYYDRTRIRQVILNLVSNAARYTDKGGITLEVKQQDHYIVIGIADTGPGIAPADTKRVFEPFYQGPGWRPDLGGSGLGLSVSKQLIELHEGEIWLESELGMGSTFYFKLPLSPPSTPVTGPGRWISDDWVFQERTSWPKIPKLPYKERVVLCDEIGLLHSMFTHYSDEIEFIDTRSLPQAVRELQDRSAHAVILNTTSPDDLGTLVDQARLAIPDTPIIGCTLPPPKNRAFAAGAIEYLMKPVTQISLEAVLQTVGKPLQRILVVDDDPDFLELFGRMLFLYDNTLEVTTAASGEQALEELRHRPPHLMLLDIVMPGMDGWQVLEHKKQDEVIKDIPVIILSAEDLMTWPLHSPVMLMTMGQGLSTNELLDYSLKFSALLLKLDHTPGPGPE
jgi:signal transduction histidine kinase/CheY-like chemotaxis protein